MNRSRIWIVLLAALLLAPAAATAQFTSDVCAEGAPSDVLDPGFPFDHANNVNECKQLCKLQGKVCWEVTRSLVGCFLDVADASLKGEAVDCKDDDVPSDCKQQVTAARRSIRGSLKAEGQDEKGNCDLYVAECQAACEEAE